MEHGRVRAILARHAQVVSAVTGAARPPDPTALLPASALRRDLEARDAAGQRALALDYVALWSRTFRPLVRHLRGRPERTLSLFAEEVYPFLRGDRRAARLERVTAHEARLLLADDLPAPYLCGLVEGFVGLSGARAVARSEGRGAVHVAYRVAAGQRLARAAQVLTALRLPLILCALLATATGIAMGGAAAAARGAWEPLVAAAVFVGVLAAQLGANALHDLRRPPGNPLGPARLPHGALRATVWLSYTSAAICGAFVTLVAGPVVLGFAAVGLLLGIAYGRFRGEGLGPVAAGLTYGALVPAGAAYALDPGIGSPVLAASVAAPLGMMAAALLLLDNVADRPLDEAGGQRTLAVRLGGPHQAMVYGGLAFGALAWLAGTSWPWFSPLPLVAAVLLAVPVAWCTRRAWTHWDDPRSLGAARVATLAVLIAVAAVPLALFAADRIGGPA